MTNIDLHYFLHGLIILMTGLIGGLPFASAIKKQNGREVAWRVVHSGSSVAGTTLIAIGAIINRLSISEASNTWIFVGVAGSTYLLVIGMVIAAITGERGIGVDKNNQNKKWKIVYYLYGIGAAIAILSFGVLIILSIQQLYFK